METHKTPEIINARKMLSSLRWKADSKIINHFGEEVWLKDCFDGGGNKIGITDCCDVDDPCLRHMRYDTFNLAIKLDDIAHNTSDMDLFCKLRIWMAFWQLSMFDDILSWPFNDRTVYGMREHLQEVFKTAGN